MGLDQQLDYQAMLDGMSQGVLIFDSANKLVTHNTAARAILGADLNMIQDTGWTAAAVLFNSRVNNPDEQADSIRSRALESSKPVRFRLYRSGEYIPCWAAAIAGTNSDKFTMITIDTPDWTAMVELVDRFRNEVQDAAHATQGHAEFILQSIRHLDPQANAATLSRRISGFTRLIATHMHRLGRLMQLLERLEALRVGGLRDTVQTNRRKIAIEDYLEEFLEELDEIGLIDPETEPEADYRSRLTVSISNGSGTNGSSGLAVWASRPHLTFILHDLLRNAIMYSMKATPIKIVVRASAETPSVQIDVVDEGYGVRGTEFEKVFMPFLRARQPQIIGEFGYGLSLYLCKHEIEAMSGRMWFESEEGVGSTFSFKLPLWQADDSAPDSSRSGS